MKEILLCLSLIFSIVHGTDVKSPCGGDDWITYEDEKCVKLFKSFLPRHQAQEVCNQQDLTGSLVAIHTAAEQKFLIEYVLNSSYSNNIWIGAERRLGSSSEFKWNDRSAVRRFTNWEIGFPTADIRRTCVHMKSPLTRDISEMQWVDVSCNSGYWFICEKLQNWPIEHFQQIILSNRREVQYLADNFIDQMTDLSNLMTDIRNEKRAASQSQTADQRSEAVRIWINNR